MSKVLTEKQQKDILAAIEEMKRIIQGYDDPEEKQPKATSKKKRS